MPAVPAETQGASALDGDASPFDLAADGAYSAWRARKLAQAPADAGKLVVRIVDPASPSAAETAAIRVLCRNHNMAFYRTEGELDKARLLAFAARLGLGDIERPLLTGEDGVTELAVAGMAESRRGIYIPYSNKPLSWHTDGYYNPVGQWVLGMLLHCVRPAESGGEAQFLDPEIAYIRLRDANPAYVAALIHPQTLTIPANEAKAGVERGAETGPVLAVIGGRLAMRYTHRLRSAVWRDDAATAAAREFLRELLEEGDPLMLTHRLAAGEGIISNNVLHRRTGFENPAGSGTGRLLYRARYRQRVQD
jgi:alpha-ketoglutarate-dependent taurine dioxygenase